MSIIKQHPVIQNEIEHAMLRAQSIIKQHPVIQNEIEHAMLRAQNSKIGILCTYEVFSFFLGVKRGERAAMCQREVARNVKAKRRNFVVKRETAVELMLWMYKVIKPSISSSRGKRL
ncbi:hypothetical protein QE152_g13404 [Popillia japonica]|uniref:Uncharacterized protein n=1 Tax=Popillia japonica TaxID=7064 RepID=A0AAW1L9Y3_POPJA